MKSKFCIYLIIMVCSINALTAQNIMKPAPEGSIVKGRLIGNVGDQYKEVITAGYVFALSPDEKQVLSYTPTARGTYTTGGGAWEVSGLPYTGKVLFVGYASNVHRLCWMQEVEMDGRKYYNLGDNVAYMVAPSADPAEAGKGVLQALYLIGWFAERIEQGRYYEKVDKLTAELDKYISGNSIGNCYKLMDNDGYNSGKYSMFPITTELKPRIPVSINITFTIDDLSSCSMLFRYGDYGIAAQIGICEGEIGGDFREGIVGDRNGGAREILGNRSLKGRIGLGRHSLKMSYDGEIAELWIDNKLVDIIKGEVDISKFDGNIWIGRNGYATYPFYFKGQIHTVEICF